MVRKDTDLPFGDAFSPKQLDTKDSRGALAVLLELADKHEGDPDAFDQEIIDRFFPDDDGTRSKNVRLGLQPAGYGIVDKDFEFTELGEELYDLRDDPDELHDRFAQHILRNLHGLKGIEIIEDLEAQGKPTTNANLKDEFEKQYGFHIDRTSNHWSQMRAWLAEAGVVNTGTHHYDIDRERIEELIGVGSEDVLEIDGLTDSQQAFLRALTLLDPDGPIKNAVVRKVAEEAYGVEISQSNISRRTLDPLQEEGYIEWEHVSGKPNLVETTEKFDAEILKPVLEDVTARTGVPRHVLRKSYAELLDDLDEGNNHERGVALETLTVKLGRTLGLEFVGWRVRGRETGGSEVDVVFDDLGTIFNRVQVQCKNVKKQLEARHIAREVGITRTLQTNTVLMIARNGVSSKAEQFAARVMQKENLAVVFIDGDDLLKLDQNTDHLFTALRGESRRIHRLKRLSSQEVEEEEEQQMADREQEALDKYADDISEGVEDEAEDASITDF
jgi:hypothetical protein